MRSITVYCLICFPLEFKLKQYFSVGNYKTFSENKKYTINLIYILANMFMSRINATPIYYAENASLWLLWYYIPFALNRLDILVFRYLADKSAEMRNA